MKIKLLNWYSNSLRPKIVFLPFWILKLLPIPFGIQNKGNSQNCKTKLCIEAGLRGWESIEFKELYTSACEYLSSEDVYKVIVNKNASYITQVIESLIKHSPTHYLYDPRTGSQNWLAGLYEAFSVFFQLHVRGVVPVVILTDCTERLWRTLSAVVTAKRGVVVTFISAKKISPIFPHRRIVGPSLMPFSVATLNSLTTLTDEKIEIQSSAARFVGSLYEPRITKLQEIADGLKVRGYELEILGRVFGGPRIPDTEYWYKLQTAPVIVTTADQIFTNKADWTWIPQMVYRYLEATACGNLLVAPDVPGVRRYFTPGIHFVPFNTVEDAIDNISYYLSKPEECNRLAKRGHDRARSLITSRVFWTNIDAGLGPDSLI